MSGTNQTIELGYAVWAGGSGDIGSSNWITGYVENIGTNGVISFVSWIYGQPVSDETAYFDPSLNVLGVGAAGVATGGTLSGSLTGYVVDIDSGSTYFVSGSLSAESVAISAGTLTVDGAGTTLSASVYLWVGGGGGASFLQISNGATLSVMDSDVGNGGTLTISGVGSTLDVSNFLGVGFDHSGVLQITTGGSASVEDLFIGYGNPYPQVGLATVDGTGSTLSVETLYVGYGGAGSLQITDGGSVTVSDSLEIGWIGSRKDTLNVSGAGSSLTVGTELDVGAWIAGCLMMVGNSATVEIADTLSVGYESIVSVDSTSEIDVGTDSASFYGAPGGGGLEVGAAGTVSIGGTTTVAGRVVIGGGDSALGNGGAIGVGGAGSVLTVGGDLEINGFIGASPALYISDGASVSVTGNSFVETGGILSIGGSGATLSVSGKLFLDGYFAAAWLEISDGAAVSVNGDTDVYSAGTITITDAGSTLTLGGVLDIEGFGSTPTFLQISNGAAVSVAGVTSVATGATLTVDGTGSTLTVGASFLGALAGSDALFVGQGSTGLLQITGGGSVTADGAAYVGHQDGGDGTLSVSGAGSVLLVGASLLGGLLGTDTLFVGDGGTGLLQISDGALVSAGTVEVDSLGSVSGSGTIDGAVDNAGTITATGGTLKITGAVTGAGTISIDSNATLEIGSTFAAGGTVDFGQSTDASLLLDDASGFSGTITGLSVGDSIVLNNASIGTTPYVISATIGQLNGIQTLRIVEGPTPNPTISSNTTIDVPIQTAGSTPLSGDFFKVSESGPTTVLTLTQGNPIALAVNAPTVWQAFGDYGANVKIGIISDSFNSQNLEASDIAARALPSAINILPGFDLTSVQLGQLNACLAQTGSYLTPDEGRAMAQVIYDIAPDATIYFACGISNVSSYMSSSDRNLNAEMQIADAVNSLVANGCNIIVDDLGVPGEPNSGSPIENAIDAAVGGKVAYVTAADNDRGQYSIYGHAADTNALTVAAMNILATPNPPSTVGGSIAPQTELFSSVGADPSKPNITGPDGGPTTFALDSGLDPFLGTSAAAPAVAAVAALMMAENQALKSNPQEVYQLVENSNSVTAFPDASAQGLNPAQTEGAGLVNAMGAVLEAQDAGCYAAGTRVNTQRGEVRVEDLVLGDVARAGVAGFAPVKWLGHRRVDCRRHPRPHDVWPVRIHAHAFGHRMPHRDLLLSPDHAVFIDGVLIPVRYLINGATIVQEPAEEVTYWHVELPRHDILLAEGLPCESFLDTGNRGAFENGGPATQLHPDFALRLWETEACARLVWNGAELVAARSFLLERAQLLGHELTRAPDLRLRVDGRALPATVTGHTYRFRLPNDGAQSLRLVSRSAPPAHVHDDSDDHRRLGVAISRIVLDGEPLALSDARLGTGWHGVEGAGANTGWRWTDGDAELVLAGGRTLDIEVVMTSAYWAERMTTKARAA